MNWVVRGKLECGCSFGRIDTTDKDKWRFEPGHILDCAEHGPKRIVTETARGA